MALTAVTVDATAGTPTGVPFSVPYARLVTTDIYTITAATFNFETYKSIFDDAISGYANLIGRYDIDLNLVDNNNGTATLSATIKFENFIDACFFDRMWPTGPTPDFCALYLPVANTDTLNWG